MSYPLKSSGGTLLGDAPGDEDDLVLLAADEFCSPPRISTWAFQRRIARRPGTHA